VSADVSDEVRAVWIAYLDIASFTASGTKSGFVAAVNKAFDKIVDLGLNTVFVQVRPFADAFYDSNYFPWSAKITGTEGRIRDMTRSPSWWTRQKNETFPLSVDQPLPGARLPAP
jgi:uncharacterized lipoprotein YddW (UPF0748 family)